MVTAVAVAAAGCSYSAPVHPPDSRAAVASELSIPTPTAAPTSVAASWGVPLSGRFVSQATRTVGVVYITGTTDGATLTLDVSTTANPDLEVMLNKGALSKDPSGNMVVEDPNSLLLPAQLKPGSGPQLFELPSFPPFRIRSVTIMDSQTHVAYGTADLSPGPATQ